jgi:N-methylhydantoinase A/oxoprolinase/acetone carboxylase beta subunit
VEDEKRLRLAVDIGGTFVDAMEFDAETGRIRFRKALTTPTAPWEGVLQAVRNLESPLDQVDLFIHGTTLGLNAVLERKGARTGIITNEGMRDIFLLGRGDIPAAHMYDFKYERPPSLVSRRWTAGVPGRLDYRGNVVEPLDEDAVRAAARTLVEEQDIESVAICFLHSFRDPTHERRAAEIVRGAYPQVTVSVSTDIVREHREYERTSTTVLDAYIRPIFERYVDRLEAGLRERSFDGRFLIMRSGGGAMTSGAAKQSPTFTILSGPAGGIVGASFLAELLDRDDLLSFDIGGTSLDTCVIERGNAVAAFEAKLEHYPLLIPIYDIRTIGAGGGSIAWIDEGLLRVGPQSAGASPGPICYGRGGVEPTVTDATVCLGYLDPSRFLAGELTLDADAAEAGLRERIADPLGISIENAAAGIVDVLLARTVGAVRQITVERGRDPRAFSLLGFGGAGPLFASLLAREMGIREVIIPLAPGGFSAWGMLSADVVNDYSRTDLRSLDDVPANELQNLFASITDEARESLHDQGIASTQAVLQRQLELRYLGQEHAIIIDVGEALDHARLRDDFEEAFRARYGHVMTDTPVQILNVRVRGIGKSRRPELPQLDRLDGDASRALIEHRQAYCFDRRARIAFAVYERDRLGPGDRIQGPAIVDEGTSTTVIHSDQSVSVDEYGHLVIQVGGS